MLYIESLDIHPSSPKSIYTEPEALAERKDLYTGDNFYFGFNAANQSFLDIIGGKQPLAIKYGPVLSLYERTAEGEHCKTYYIDRESKSLRPIVEFHSTIRALGSVDTLIPWSFTDTYATPPRMGEEASDATSDESLITSVLEDIATLKWPTPELVRMLPEIEARVTAKRAGVTIKFSDLDLLKKQVTPEKEVAAAERFIAAYNPFLDNPRIKYSVIKTQNPDHITIRKVDDKKHPRIEIIAPELPVEEGYIMLFKEGSEELYKAFNDALDKKELLTQLVREHYPALVPGFNDASGRLSTP